MDGKKHITVLEKEAVEALNIKPSATVIDATLGRGGHAERIVAQLGTQGTFIGIDADSEAVSEGVHRLKHAKCKVQLTTGNFRDIDALLASLQVSEADAILADLGWRMDQFGGNGKGFSFLTDEELIMTFGDPTDYPFVAKDIVNDWKEEDLKNVLKGYGEERFAGRIAKAIVSHREKKPIVSTFDLVKVIAAAVPGKYRHGRIHPATRTFQALRIAVNDELETLKAFIEKSVHMLGTGGRLAIISFHSLEDRIVKHSFREFAQKMGTVITKKPITAARTEISQNPRSRSAKLRIFEKA